MGINVISNNKVNVINGIKINVVSNNNVIMTLKLMLLLTIMSMLSITLKCYLLISCHCKDGKNWPGKRKRSNNIMRTSMIKLKIINLNEPPVQTFIEEQRNQSQKKMRNKLRILKNKQKSNWR